MRESKVLRIIIGIIAIVFVVHQIYSSAYKPITTVSAEYYTAVEGFQINAIVIREEKIIKCDTDGTLHFTLSNGERVSKNGTIANIYSSAETSATVTRIEQLKTRIADIEEIQSYNDVEATDIKLTNTKVNNSLNKLLRSIAAGNYQNVEEESVELLTNISRKQMITGEQTDLSSRLDQLKNELDGLEASLPAPLGSITTEQSGYFVSNNDGYENVLSCEKIDDITPEYLDSLKPKKIPDNAIGKIVSDYTWYIAAKVNISDSLKYKEGDELVLRTSLKLSPEINVKVEKINSSKKDSTAVIIFSCQQMNSELATMRKGSMTIVNKVHSGLKVPAKALRFQNDKAGVFVRSGMTLKFVEVNVIYRTDEYIICEQEASNKSVLRLYDDVVVKGKKLYDGKIVD